MSKVISLLILIVLIGAAAFFYFTQNAPKRPPGIAFSGNIEITEVEVSFKIPGRVVQRMVSEGDLVEEGQLVAILDKVDLAHEVALRKAEVQAARASLLELKEGYLPEEIAQAEAKVRQTEADLRRTESDFKRQKRLFEQEVISRREFETSQTTFSVNQARYQEAVQYLELLKKGTRPEKIDQAVARLHQAQQTLLMAETRLSDAELYSPLTGMVVAKHIEPGEYVTTGTPIVTIGDLNHVWLRGYINETELGNIQLGQRVEVRTDTFPNKVYEGHLVFISPQAEFTPKNVQTEKERVKLVYRIKVDIDNSNHELKPGMPADGFITLGTSEEDPREHHPN
jgi:HlyD family secretion protein